MKNFNLVSVLMIFVGSFLLVQCTSEPIEGPPGADGAEGTASCIACHSDTHRAPIYDAYLLSFHSKGLTEGAVEYAGARSSCAECHSHEGFRDFQDNGFTSPTGYYGYSEPELLINDNGTPNDPTDDYPELDDYGQPIYTNNPVPFVTPIGCTTCHDTHISFDFENDGQDYALRGIDPIALMTDDTMIDYIDGSNNCINCHQPRRTGPEDDGTGNFTITSSHWGPHHGPQATLLEGIQGAEIAGSTPYPADASAAHRTGSTCISCHMGATTNGTDGLHTFIPTDNACTGCHTNGIPADDFLSADMATLAALLEAAGPVHDDHPVPGSYPIVEAQAAWNYLFVLEDASNGVHNPGYAKALIKNSIEALQ